MPKKKLFFILLFLGLIVVAAAGVWFWKNVFRKAEQKVYTIGALIDTDTQLPAFDGFKAGMAELGYREGSNINYVLKNPQADVALRKEYAKSLMESNLDLIVTGSTSATVPFRGAEKRGELFIPVVFLDAGNPSELVENPFAPQGLITGVAGGHVDFVGNRIQLLQELDPSIKNIAVMAESTHANYDQFLRLARQSAEILGMKIVEVHIKGEGDAKDKVKTIDRSVADAFLFFTSASNTKNTKFIADHFKEMRMITAGHNLEVGVEKGVMIVYGSSRYATGKQAATMAHKIFNGVAIKHIPVELSRDQFLEINLTTAQAIGFSVPQHILARASRLYEE